LLNLLSNAVKYNRPNGTIALSVEMTELGRIRISVADTGPGIPIEKQNDLFTPFARLGAETTEVEGTGIGLTITKRLVEAMDGSIGFSSTEGEGTIFWINLPAASSPRTAIEPIASASSLVINSLEVGQLRMVYIEDNKSNVALMENLVEEIEGLTMSVAATAELGLEEIERTLPDIVLLDINLPGMNGIEAVRQIKSNPKIKDIPVLALSADAIPGTVRAALDAGCFEYLTKPVDIARLLTVIRMVIKERQHG
jgi:CheY-like chemotaxis protein